MQRTANETTQLLQWIRKSVSSPRWYGLQDLANGVVWCRLMAKVLPGSIASVLIIHRPANERDAMHNYMLLQAAFGKVNIPWYFDTKKLIAGNESELLKLAQSMARLRDACNNQLQHDQKKSMQRPNSQRLSRFLAGELEAPQQLPMSQDSMGAVINVPLESELQQLQQQQQQQQQQLQQLQQQQQQQQTMVIDQEPTQYTAGREESQLKQQIETLYHNQQLAMAATQADEQSPLAAGHPIDPVSAFRPAAIVECLCSKCISNRQKLANAANEALE